MEPPTIHQAATTGFNNAQAYDTHRPSYPPAAVQALLAHLDLVGRPGARIVDLAAGTGKFTEALAARDEKFEIMAVEPLGPMRDALREKRLPGVSVEEGAAADMPVGDGWADGVVVAQAFHWFATEDALKEIHRVLKPEGKLAMIWNVEDYNKPAAWQAVNKWGQALNDLIFSLPLGGQPRFRGDAWRGVFDEQTLFSKPLEEEKLSWDVSLSVSALWGRVATLSQVAMLEGEERMVFKETFRELVKGGDGRWNQMGEVSVHGVTFYTWTTKL